MIKKNTIALMELPEPFPLTISSFVRPAKLSSDCIRENDENVIVAGIGQQLFDRDTGFDGKIRHAYLRTIRSGLCAGENDPKSVICTVPIAVQSPYSGDSGSNE